MGAGEKEKAVSRRMAEGRRIRWWWRFDKSSFSITHLSLPLLASHAGLALPPVTQEGEEEEEEGEVTNHVSHARAASGRKKWPMHGWPGGMMRWWSTWWMVREGETFSASEEEEAVGCHPGQKPRPQLVRRG